MCFESTGRDERNKLTIDRFDSIQLFVFFIRSYVCMSCRASTECVKSMGRGKISAPKARKTKDMLGRRDARSQNRAPCPPRFGLRWSGLRVPRSSLERCGAVRGLIDALATRSRRVNQERSRSPWRSAYIRLFQQRTDSHTGQTTTISENDARRACEPSNPFDRSTDCIRPLLTPIRCIHSDRRLDQGRSTSQQRVKSSRHHGDERGLAGQAAAGAGGGARHQGLGRHVSIGVYAVVAGFGRSR